MWIAIVVTVTCLALIRLTLGLAHASRVVDGAALAVSLDRSPSHTPQIATGRLPTVLH